MKESSMPTSVGPLKPEILTDDDIRSEAIARLLEKLAWLMDQAIPIPGTKFRVGLDAILGLLPVGGDLLCGLIQSGVVLTALKHYRVPKAVAARMAANVLIDIAVGSIPFVGDAFDAVFKANTLNLKLLGEVRQLQSRGAPVPAAPSAFYLLGIAAILLVALGLIFVGMVTVAALIFKAIVH
jgi:Domain of unknown function (DUF4112)